MSGHSTQNNVSALGLQASVRVLGRTRIKVRVGTRISVGGWVSGLGVGTGLR